MGALRQGRRRGKRSPTFIRLALLPEFARGLDSGLAPVLVQVRIAHDFAADELVLEIGVDDTCRLGRLRSLADGPGTNFIGSAGEIPNELGTGIGCVSRTDVAEAKEDSHLERCILPALSCPTRWSRRYSFLPRPSLRQTKVRDVPLMQQRKE
jgi:hypothetical protein